MKAKIGDTVTITLECAAAVTGVLVKIECAIAYIRKENGNIYLCPDSKI
jgi:hypothetical protein